MSKSKDKPTLSESTALTPQEISQALSDAPDEYLQVLAPTIKEFIGLVQIATAGRVESVQELLSKPGNFIDKLLQEDQGLLMGFIEAKGLDVLLRPVDADEKLTWKTKLEWAKLLRDIIIYEESKKFEPKGFKRPDGKRASGEVARFDHELLQELDGDGKAAGPEKSSKSGC